MDNQGNEQQLQARAAQMGVPYAPPTNVPQYADGGQVGLPTGVPPGGQQMYQQYANYADGGQVGMGVPGQQNMLDPQMADQQINSALSVPGAKEKIQQAVQQAVQAGEIDLNMAHMAVQLCKAVIQNPKLWPQLRKFAVQKGLCGPTDLPEQYDQGLVLAILTAAKAAEGMLQNGQGPQGIQPPPGMGPGAGGQLQGPGTGTSDSIPATNLADGGQVNVSTGEYVIPADVVKAKGKDFFDAMVRKYHTPTGYKG